MKKELIFVLLNFIIINYLFAQNEADTILYLPEVNIHSNKSTLLPGMNIYESDSILLAVHKHFNLADILSQSGTVHIRNYGAGLLSTINARGLGANHTSVLWNGIPINSVASGLTDISIIPVQSFDELNIVTGGTGSVYGNNSMGIAVELNNKWSNENNFSFSALTGSFGTQSASITFNYSWNKFKSKSLINQNRSENNFSFTNLTLADKPIQNQTNSEIKSINLLQMFKWDINEKLSTETGIWFSSYNRQIPPLMFTMLNNEHQADTNLRTFFNINFISKKISLHNRSSYIQDILRYDNRINNIYGASVINNFRNEIEIIIYTSKWMIQGALSGYIANADIKDYNERKKMERLSVNTNLKYFASDKFTIGAGLKKEFSSPVKAPTALSLGGNYSLSSRLEANFNFSSVYTLPTLNDLFWIPGGNSRLKSENGFTTQSSVRFKYNNSNFLQIGAFYTNIKNWIQWIPSNNGLFSPYNIKQVESAGIEFSINSQFSLNNLQFRFISDYSYTRAINKVYENNTVLENKSLIYNPEHLANAHLSAKLKKIVCFINSSYTGSQYITADNTNELPSYIVVNSGILFNSSYDRFAITIQPEIRNIFNEQYQTLPWRPMPGRSYYLTLTLDLNLNKKV